MRCAGERAFDLLPGGCHSLGRFFLGAGFFGRAIFSVVGERCYGRGIVTLESGIRGVTDSYCRWW